MFHDIIRRYLDLTKQLVEYEKLEIEVKQLSGYNFTVLRELFAKGYTLEPPKSNDALLAKMAEMAVEDDRWPNCFGHYYLEPFNRPCEDGEAGLCSHCRECRRADPLY